jgi:LacI family transcriptional regulator
MPPTPKRRKPMRASRRHAAPARPTILDVAREAGVSLGTVSNVLNGRANVSARRRASVDVAIASLGYVPNGLAQSLRRQRSRVIGLCMPLSSNAYFAALLEAFETIAAAQGYELMQVLSRHDPALELRRVRALIARQVDGLIVVPSADAHATFDAIATAGMPAVMVDRAAADERFDYVTLDDRGAMAEATHALLRIGHRRLLFVVRHPNLITTRERIAGFHAAAAGVPGARADVLVRSPDDAAFAADLRERLCAPERPTALVASNSDLAIAVLRNLEMLRLRCPADLSLLTFDAPAWADVVTPPLSVVHPPTRELADRAWEVLLARMDGRAGRPRRIVLAARLELRASVAAPPASRDAPRSAGRRAPRARAR